MTEGVEDFSAGPSLSPGAASPTDSPLDTGPVPEEKPEETEAAAESGDEGVKRITEGGSADGDEEQAGASENVALPATCCVCIEMEQINHCLHSEKICILPILACLLSLALCTAGLKWVFVDKIFEYEPPTHLDPKPIGQDPFIISVNPTLGINVSTPRSSPATVSLSTTVTVTVAPEHPEVLVEGKSTAGPYGPQPTRVTNQSVTLKYNAERTTAPKSPRSTTPKSDNIVQNTSTTSTSTTTKSSSHIMRCSDSQKNYCVNGGECFTLEIMPGSTKFLCRCLEGFTGHRCEQAVLKKVSDHKQAEELYQKRILTISGICIALLVVGIMCVVAYCKTKKQRKKLRDRLRQSKKNKRKSKPSSGAGSNLDGSTAGRQSSNVPLQDLTFENKPCNGSALQNVTEETEATFPTSKYTSANQPTTLTNISSQRFESSMRSPTQASLESKTVSTTPGSPLSETFAPLSSPVVSVLSEALSPSAEEERFLLSSRNSQPHVFSRPDDQKTSYFYYNHSHVAHSLPPSPALTARNSRFGVPGDSSAASQSYSALPEKLTDPANNTRNCSPKRGAWRAPHHVESSCDSVLLSEAEDSQGGDAGSTTALWNSESSRTNPASPKRHLQVQRHNPVAV